MTHLQCKTRSISNPAWRVHCEPLLDLEHKKKEKKKNRGEGDGEVFWKRLALRDVLRLTGLHSSCVAVKERVSLQPKMYLKKKTESSSRLTQTFLLFFPKAIVAVRIEDVRIDTEILILRI